MRSPVSDSSHRPSPGPAPTALHRLRAASGCPRPSMSPSSRSGIVVQVVAIGKFCAHRPHRAHRAPPPASPSRVVSAPGPWLARIAPYASLFRRMREKGPLPGNIRPKCMLFEIKMATSSPYASISERNRAIRDTWRANLAAKGPFSCRGARNHAWREDVASAVRPFRGSGMRHAAWPNGLCALRRGPGLLAACAPPAISLVSAAARVHRRRLIRVALRRPHRVHRAQSSAAPPIAVGVSADRALPAALVLPTPTHRAHQCALAGTARAPTRANRAPAPSQPDPGPEQTGPRPPVEPPAPIRAPPLAAPHPAARVPLRFR